MSFYGTLPSVSRGGLSDLQILQKQRYGNSYNYPSYGTSSLPTGVGDVVKKVATTAATNVALSAASSLTSSVGNMLAGSGKSLDSTDTSLKTASNFKTNIPDPITSSFSRTKPHANTFVTQSIVTNTEQIDFGNKAGLRSDRLATMDPNQLKAIAARFGSEMPSMDADIDSLMTLSIDDVRDDAMTKFSVDLENAQSDMSLSDFFSNMSSDAGSIVDGISDFTSEVTSNFPDLGDITDTITDVYDSTLPMVADAWGNPVDGIPTNTNLRGYRSVRNSSSMFCDNINLADPTNFGYLQNLFNMFLGYLTDNDLFSALSQFLNCQKYMNDSSYGIVSSRVGYAASRGSVGTVRTIVDTVGGGRVPNSYGVVRDLLSSDTLTIDDVGDVQYIMEKVDVTSEDIYGNGRIGDRIIWNTPRMNSGNPDVVDSIIGTPIRKLTTGTILV